MRELVRSVEGVSGRVPMRWRCAPRFDYGRRRPRGEWRHGIPVAAWGGEAIAIASWDAGTPVWRDAGAEAEFEVAGGGCALLAMSSAYAEPLILPGRQSVMQRLALTAAFWERWSRAHDYAGAWAISSSAVRSRSSC